MSKMRLLGLPLALASFAACKEEEDKPADSPTAAEVAPAMSPEDVIPPGQPTAPPLNPSTATPPGVNVPPPSTVPPEKMPE